MDEKQTMPKLGLYEIPPGYVSIPEDDLMPNHAYLLRARNIRLGVWDSSRRGFVGVRTKFGDRFVDLELLYQEKSGTAIPYYNVGLCPIKDLSVNRPVPCSLHHMVVSWHSLEDKNNISSGEWQHEDGSKVDTALDEFSLETNFPLLAWLDEQEQLFAYHYNSLD